MNSGVFSEEDPLAVQLMKRERERERETEKNQSRPDSLLEINLDGKE